MSKVFNRQLGLIISATREIDNLPSGDIPAFRNTALCWNAVLRLLSRNGRQVTVTLFWYCLTHFCSIEHTHCSCSGRKDYLNSGRYGKMHQSDITDFLVRRLCPMVSNECKFTQTNTTSQFDYPERTIKFVLDWYELSFQWNSAGDTEFSQKSSVIWTTIRWMIFRKSSKIL